MVTDFETIKEYLKYCTDELKKLKINLIYIIEEEKVILKLCAPKIKNTSIKNLEMNLTVSTVIFGRYTKDEILNYLYQTFITEVADIKCTFNEVNND